MPRRQLLTPIAVRGDEIDDAAQASGVDQVLVGDPGSELVDAVIRIVDEDAQRLQVKAGRVGFDWTRWQDAWSKVGEEMAEMGEALQQGEPAHIREELGDLLFSVVNVARLSDIDAEDCLRHAADKFTRRFKEVEADMRARGRTVSETSAEDLDRAWEAVKTRERDGATGTQP